MEQLGRSINTPEIKIFFQVHRNLKKKAHIVIFTLIINNTRGYIFFLNDKLYLLHFSSSRSFNCFSFQFYYSLKMLNWFQWFMIIVTQ